MKRREIRLSLRMVLLSLLSVCISTTCKAGIFGLGSGNTMTIIGDGIIEADDVANLMGWENVTNVVISSNSITGIGNGAFKGFGSKVSSINLPSSIKSIGDEAFYGTNLSSIIIPGKVLNIGKRAFYGTKITSITLESGESELNIGSYAFANLPSNVTFNCDRNFKYQDFDSSYFPQPFIGGIFYNSKSLSKVVIGSNVTEIPHESFCGCGYLTSVDMTNASSLLTIGYSAFSQCDRLDGITLPFGLKSIEKEAFYGCGINPAVTIPSSVTYIGERAFGECYNLMALYILGNPQTASNSFDSSYNIIRCYQVSYDKWLAQFTDRRAVKELFIPGNNVSNHFYSEDNNLNHLFPNVEKVIFGPEVTVIHDCIFYVRESEYTNNIYSVEFQGDVSVGMGAFYDNMNLTDINMERITYCYSWCFTCCEKLTSVNLENCSGIQPNAFYGCSALNEVTVSTPLTYLAYDAFAYCPSIRTLNINSPALLGEDYNFGSSLGSRFGEDLMCVNIGPNVMSIGENAFSDCRALRNVTINSNRLVGRSYSQESNLTDVFPYITKLTFGENVNSVGSNSFYVRDGKMKTLKSVTFSQPVFVYAHAFSNNTLLSSINGRVESVQDYSFSNCGITNITITDDFELEEGAFKDCKSLKTITLPSELSKIDANVFCGCAALAEIALPESLVSVGQRAFEGCTSLRSITLPSECVAIASDAFKGCTSLSMADIPSHVAAIGMRAFMDCTNLTMVVCRVAEPISIDASVFGGVPMERAELIVPQENVAAYKSAPVWRDFYECFPIGIVHLYDGETFANDADREVPMIRYTRTFSEKTTGKWQCLYVPFDIAITDELLEDFDFAQLYMASYKDSNGNGEIEDGEPLAVVLYKMTEGKTIKANTPSFIRAKSSGKKNIDVEDAVLKSAQSGTVYCCTTQHGYTVTGTNEVTNINGLYTINVNGQLDYYSEDTNLKPNRWYMDIRSLSDNESVAETRLVTILVDGEDDTSGIVDMTTGVDSSCKEVFTLDGRKIGNTQSHSRGIYIIDGKKVFVP